MKKILLIIALVLSLPSFGKQRSYKLWYDKPASAWTEVLPLGNGRLGERWYLVNPSVERLQLNEETIWAGKPNDNANPEAKEYPENQTTSL